MFTEDYKTTLRDFFASNARISKAEIGFEIITMPLFQLHELTRKQ